MQHETADSMKLVTVINNPNSRIQKYLPSTASKLLLLPGSGFLRSVLLAGPVWPVMDTEHFC